MSAVTRAPEVEKRQIGGPALILPGEKDVGRALILRPFA